MDKFLVDRIQLTVDNYRLAKEELRNDGDIINHFASLVFSHYEKEILVERVKEIRKDIKLNTPRISPFRGDTLNILSLLIATVDKEKQEQLIQDMYDTMEILEEEGFLSGSYLALTAFTISKYAQLKDKRYIISKIKELFIILKEKYSNIDNVVYLDLIENKGIKKGSALKILNYLKENYNGILLYSIEDAIEYWENNGFVNMLTDSHYFYN